MNEDDEGDGVSEVNVPAGAATLAGELGMVTGARGVVLFAHGSGSGRKSPRNQFVATYLRRLGLATLLVDLLTLEEEAADLRTGYVRFDIGLLADRVVFAIDWLGAFAVTAGLGVGLFGASTGAAAALVAASERPAIVRAVVSRGGRADLAGAALPLVKAPTLLLVGGADSVVLDLNQQAFESLGCQKGLIVIPRATHLFEEPGALAEVARLAGEWFERAFGPARSIMKSVA